MNNDWILVTERLPKDGESVLIAVTSNTIWITLASHYSPFPQWSSSDGYYFRDLSYSRVTHWMPLPEFPKEYE